MMKKTVILVAVFLLLQLAAFRTVGADYATYPGNHCLSFDGAETYVSIGQSANSMFQSTQVTIEAWVKPTYDILSGSSGGVVVTRSAFNYGLMGGWVFEFRGDTGQLRFGFTDSNTSLTSDAIDSNQAQWSKSSWYYIAVTYDPTLPNGNMKLWVNGTLDNQEDDHHSIYYDSRPLLIGGFGVNNIVFNGFIDEVRIWNVSRTATEIQNSWNRILNNTEITNSSLVGYWRFDDGSNSATAQDSSLYNDHGTLSLMPPQWISVGAPIVDQIPPLIKNVYQQPTNVTGVLPNDSVIVYATITDDLAGVEEAVLNYTTGNGTWNPVQMVNITGSQYNATIPPFPYGTNVTYVIMAEDGAGNTITTQEMQLVYQYAVTPEFSSILLLLVVMATISISVILIQRRLRKSNHASLSEHPELQ